MLFIAGTSTTMWSKKWNIADVIDLETVRLSLSSIASRISQKPQSLLMF